MGRAEAGNPSAEAARLCVRAGKMMGEIEAFLSRLWVEGWKEGIGRKSQVLSIRI